MAECKMKCPKCGMYLLYIIDSRPTNGHIRRRRVCLECEHRFTTYEISSGEYDALKEKEKLLYDLLARTGKISEKLKGIESRETESFA
jgi:transposase-like protein